MRISDWSSDVCSSDLRRTRTASIPPPERHTGADEQPLSNTGAPVAVPQASATMDRDAVLARYRVVRGLTERLAAPLSAEDAQVQSMTDARPTKWLLAHTSWFFANVLLPPSPTGSTAFHPASSH